MDHHKGLSVTANVDGFEDSYYYGRRPTNIYIPRFRNVHEQIKHFVRGYHYGAGAYRGRQTDDTNIGVALKENITEAGGWHIGLYAFGECLPYADNRITLNHAKKDQWGRPIITIDCSFKDNEKAMFADIATTGKEMLETAGYKDVNVSGSMSFPGNANHEMGTARMGRDAKTSVLNAHNQMHQVRNIFISDGSCMASASCVNPSLTYMALTARACHYAVQELKKGNI